MKTLRIEPLFGLKLIPDAKAIPFMRARLAGIAMSILFSLASIALFFKPGLNYGVDFRGGIQMEVVTKGPADLSSLRSGLDSLGLGEVVTGVRQSIDGARPGRTAARRRRRPKRGRSKHPGKAFGDCGRVPDRADGGCRPEVSGELASTDIWSVALASFTMLICIWVRFEWAFAIGAIATLVQLDRESATGRPA